VGRKGDGGFDDGFMGGGGGAVGVVEGGDGGEEGGDGVQDLAWEGVSGLSRRMLGSCDKRPRGERVGRDGRGWN
jgi:hypothetical protein